MDNNKVKAPFTDWQVERINKFQESNAFLSSTCMGVHCDRSKMPYEGRLIAKKEGLVCPCGKYTQDECNPFIIDYEDDKLYL
jgi:hypothetical protein